MGSVGWEMAAAQGMKNPTRPPLHATAAVLQFIELKASQDSTCEGGGNPTYMSVARSASEL